MKNTTATCYFSSMSKVNLSFRRKSSRENTRDTGDGKKPIWETLRKGFESKGTLAAGDSG